MGFGIIMKIKKSECRTYNFRYKHIDRLIDNNHTRRNQIIILVITIQIDSIVILIII